MAQVIIWLSHVKQAELNNFHLIYQKHIIEAAEQKHLALDFGLTDFKILVFWNKIPSHPRRTLTIILYINPDGNMGLRQRFSALW
jgi:hypothetical protein